MRRVLLAMLMVLMSSPAWPLAQSQIPTKQPIPWGNSAGNPTFIRTIPQTSQIGIQNCAASYPDGFPPLTFQPISGGGCAPFGQDMNGILNAITQWTRWHQTGAYVVYDSGFSSSIGGYPNGATLLNASTPGCVWMSTVDNNTSNPDTGGANWASACFGTGPYTTGSAGLVPYLNVANQTLTGGANVTTLAQSAGSIVVNCGLRPLQYIPNTGVFTITAPSADGTCMLQIENGAGAGAVTFSGFTVNGNTGEPLTTTNGSKFVVTIWRIHGTASYLIKALQ
jgi:hypothetical protein